MTKFHHLPLEKLCIKFGAIVRPVNIMLKLALRSLTNKYLFGYGHKTVNMTHFGIFYFVLMLSNLTSNNICLIHIRIAGIQLNQTYKKIKYELKTMIKMKFIQLLQMFYFYCIYGCAYCICLAYFS